MSEKIQPSKHEGPRGSELNASELTNEAVKKSQEKASKSSHEHKKNLENIRSQIEQESTNKKDEAEKILRSEETEKDDRSAYVGKDLLEESYRRTLRRTRHKLSPQMRTFSKVVHNPVVESVSEVLDKTVARPSGVLAGGVFALVGSSTLLWIARHYGYEYNFLVFALLFAAGFFIGLLVELVLRITVLKRKHK